MTAPGRDLLSRTLRALIPPGEQRAVAQRAGISDATLSRYIAGKVMPPERSLRRLLEAAGADDATRDQLLEARALIREGHASRRVAVSMGSAAMQRQYGRIERDSALIQEFLLSAPPGLAQTADYMRGIWLAGPGDDAAVEATTQARLDRQKLLDDPARQFEFIVMETALRRNFRSAEVMADQVERVAALCRSPEEHIRVGVIPWWRSLDVFPESNFTMYDERTVIVGTGLGGVLVFTKPGDVAPFVELFGSLRDAALFGEDGAGEADRIAHEYRGLVG